MLDGPVIRDPDLSWIACPVQCQCGDVLIAPCELQDHFRTTGHPYYQPINGGYT